MHISSVLVSYDLQNICIVIACLYNEMVHVLDIVRKGLRTSVKYSYSELQNFYVYLYATI